MRPSGERSAVAVASIPRFRRFARAGRLLESLLDASALQAAGADVGARRLAFQEHADALEVRVEAPLRGHHRVAPVVAEARLLPADCADLRHRPSSVAKPYKQ